MMVTSPEKKSKSAKSAGTRKYSYVARDPVATKKRILDAAIKEFASKGFSGARVENIAKRSKSNMRMLYHYYDNKENLYIAAIENVYQTVRLAEQDLHIEEDEPMIGLERLVDFTFRHFASSSDLIRIVMNENLLEAKYLKKSELVPAMTTKLSTSLKVLLERGVREGVFVKNADPSQLWLTIFSLCWVHLANRYTMSWTLQTDLANKEWLESRRRHVIDVVTTYLCAPETSTSRE
jgi:AcrR family transcriptional regulator